MKARTLFALKKKESDIVFQEAIELDPMWKIANLQKKKLLSLKNFTEIIKVETKEKELKKEEIKESKTEDKTNNKTN